MKNKYLRNVSWYVVLITGGILLYYIHIERWFYEVKEGEAASKVDFVYQQF